MEKSNLSDREKYTDKKVYTNLDLEDEITDTKVEETEEETEQPAENEDVETDSEEAECEEETEDSEENKAEPEQTGKQSLVKTMKQTKLPKWSFFLTMFMILAIFALIAWFFLTAK